MYIHKNVRLLHGFINHYYIYAVIIYIMSFILASALALPGSMFFLIAAGLLFGASPGFVYSSIGATIGAAILFLIARYLIGTWVQTRYAGQLAQFNQQIELHGNYYLFFMRLTALVPFFLVNLLSGITLMPLRSFIGITFMGIIPNALVFGFAGQALAQMSSLSTFFEPPVLLAFGILIGIKVIVLPFIYIHIKNHA